MNNLDVTASISTRDRYDVLILALQAIAFQTTPPKHLFIFDDGAQADLRQNIVYANIFKLLEQKGINWRVIFGEKKGQVKNHQKTLDMAQTPFIWRLDDDTAPEPQVLETLYKHMSDPKVGAVAGPVAHLDGFLPKEATSPFIEDSLFKYSIQFAKVEGVKEVQHMYSTFLYRKTAAKHGYPTYLSTVGHREETIFSHGIFRAGWKLLVDGNAITWHLKCPTGGIRGFNNVKLWEDDDRKYIQKLKEWGVRPNEYFLCHLNNGVGDHYVFKGLLPEIRAKHPDKKIIVAACYPDVFFDEENLEVISLNAGAALSRKPLEAYDIYKFGHDNKWTGHISEIYRKLYEL